MAWTAADQEVDSAALLFLSLSDWLVDLLSYPVVAKIYSESYRHDDLDCRGIMIRCLGTPPIGLGRARARGGSTVVKQQLEETSVHPAMRGTVGCSLWGAHPINHTKNLKLLALAHMPFTAAAVALRRQQPMERLHRQASSTEQPARQDKDEAPCSAARHLGGSWVAPLSTAMRADSPCLD